MYGAGSHCESLKDASINSCDMSYHETLLQLPSKLRKKRIGAVVPYHAQSNLLHLLFSLHVFILFCSVTFLLFSCFRMSIFRQQKFINSIVLKYYIDYIFLQIKFYT